MGKLGGVGDLGAGMGGSGPNPAHADGHPQSPDLGTAPHGHFPVSHHSHLVGHTKQTQSGWPDTPIFGPGEFSVWTRCLSSLVGRPAALLFPVHRLIVASVFRTRPSNLRDQRDRLMVALSTICCLRVSARELAAAALQVCDIWFDFHTGYVIPGFRGKAAISVGAARMTANVKGIILQSGAPKTRN
jgi:hypothetical protein